VACSGNIAVMRVHELTRAECEEVLARARVGRLACSVDDQPYIVPVQVYFDSGSLFGFGTVGQRVEWMRENPLVCLEVEEIVDVRHWTTVLVFGAYEELSKTSTAPEQQEARRQAEALFGQRPSFWAPATAKRPSGEPFSPVLYRINITRMTGRRTLGG
jgi:uncharacterized protein